MTRVRLSRAAAEDVKELRRYTLEHFGVHQATRVREQLQATLEKLARFPETGRHRTDLSPPGRDLRYFPFLGRFVIVYETADGGLRVARLLHGARNLAAELTRDSGRR